MENFMRARVQGRLNALGINAFQAAKAAGLNRYIVFDLIEGKKETIRQAAIVKLAEALECDPEYLIGAQATPRKDGPPPDADRGATRLQLAGTCEAGAWRKPGAVSLPHDLSIVPDARFDPALQRAYLVRGRAAEPLGIRDGDVLVTVAGGGVREGDIVVVSRSRRGGVEEISARQIRGDVLASGSRDIPDLAPGAAEIIGRVIYSHRVF